MHEATNIVGLELFICSINLGDVAIILLNGDFKFVIESWEHNISCVIDDWVLEDDLLGAVTLLNLSLNVLGNLTRCTGVNLVAPKPSVADSSSLLAQLLLSFPHNTPITSGCRRDRC